MSMYTKTYMYMYIKIDIMVQSCHTYVDVYKNVDVYVYINRYTGAIMAYTCICIQKYIHVCIHQ